MWWRSEGKEEGEERGKGEKKEGTERSSYFSRRVLV
jgi:hypothetical protein